MSFCSECGRQLPDTAIFCPNCGHRCVSAAFNSADEDAQDKSESFVGCSASADTSSSFAQYSPQYGLNSNIYKQSVEPKRKSDGSKAVVIIVCTFLVLFIIAAALFISFKNDESSSYIGYWVSREVAYGGEWSSTEMYGNQVDGMFAVQIEEDGSISLSSDFVDSISSGTWEESKSGIVARINDEDAYFIYDESDKTLSLDYGDGVYIIFYRTEGDISGDGVSDNPVSTNTISGSGTIGSSYISVIGAEEFYDVDNNAALRIYYEFTNNSEHEASADSAIEFSAKQDGSNLSATYAWDDTDVFGNDELYVRPGVTIQCCCEFKYDPDGGGIDITAASSSDDKSGGSVTATYLPGELPGAPAPFVAKTHDDPQWTYALPSDTSIDDYYISVLQAELTTDYYDTPAIRVYYEFTNNSDSDRSLNEALFTIAYQDGIELEYTSELVGLKSDENYFTPISPGQTVRVSCVFILRNSSSPVEAEVESYSSYNAVGQTYKIK